MAEDFRGGVCGGSWWNPSRSLFSPSPCSFDAGSFGWINNNHDNLVAEMAPAASISDDSGGGAGSAASDSSVVIQNHPAGDGHVSVASTLEKMGIDLSSPPAAISTDHQVWNQGYLRSDDNYPPINKNFYQDSFINSNFGQMNDSLISSFPLNSATYTYNSSILQTLFDTDISQPLQSLSDSRPTNYSSSPSNYQMNLSEILPNLTETSPVIKPNSFPKKQPGNNHLQFTNNTSFWNATASAVLPSARPQFRPPSLATARPNLRQPNPKHHNKEAAHVASSANRTSSNEPAGTKRARAETPTPFPPFKVRKEKLGDRITALQQLVSPFGKTDTASVLQEAIEYIKFLHDQVNVLSAPYLKNESPPLQHQQVDADDRNNKDKAKGLISRGLCLVPISSTFPVTSETTSDFWTPTFGGGFR